MGLDYVDIFYSHRYDPDTPLEETMGALDTAVRSGRALYAGISSYGPQRTREAAAILRDLKVPFVVHQPSYSMLNRWVENGLLDVLQEEGLAASPSRRWRKDCSRPNICRGFPAHRARHRTVPSARPCSPRRTSRMYAPWMGSPAGAGKVLRKWPWPGSWPGPAVTSALIGASSWQQIDECLGALDNLEFSPQEVESIDRHARDAGLNIWAASSQSG